MTRRRWSWVIGRWSWVVAGAVLVALVAGAGAVVALRAESPERVVTQYLELLRARDAEAALAYTDVVAELDEVSDDLLVAEAMTGDWRITRVVRRHTEDDDPATVDVTLTAADGTAREGRFELVRDGRSWTIRNPLVRLNLSPLPLTYADFNGVTSQAQTVWLFPGAYRPYADASRLVTLGVATYVAVPQSTSYPDGGLREEVYLPSIGFTDGFYGELHRQLSAWIDGCAARAQPYPAGCPFAAGDPDTREIWVGRDDYWADEDTTLTWRVLDQPQVRLEQADGAFTVHVVRPGQLRISGTATPRFGDGSEDFRGVCGLWLPDLRVTLGDDSEFAFHPHPWSGNYACTLTGRYGQL